MILNFDEFQKVNQSGTELNNIRIKNLNIFKKKGFPSKREENWKYTDLKTILSNNLSTLEIPNNKITSQYNSEWLLKDFKHNQIVLVNGDFVSSDFSFEDKEKIKIKPLKIVFHCFTGSKKLRNFCLDNGFFISLSGIVTFKNAHNLREVINIVPTKYILIETDSPFLSPAPNRGKINEPSYIKFIAKYLSDLYKISLDEFIEITDNNFYKLFSKAIRYNEIS